MLIKVHGGQCSVGASLWRTVFCWWQFMEDGVVLVAVYGGQCTVKPYKRIGDFAWM